MDAGQAAHSALARGQLSVLDAATWEDEDAAAGGEEDASAGGLLPSPPTGDEARQELDTTVTTAVVVVSRPSNAAKSRAAIISCAPTGALPKNNQEAANRAKQLFAYMIKQVFRTGVYSEADARRRNSPPLLTTASRSHEGPVGRQKKHVGPRKILDEKEPNRERESVRKQPSTAKRTQIESLACPPLNLGQYTVN